MKRLIRKIAEKIKLVDILNPDNIDDFGINTDYGNRASAIVFLNGKVVEGDIHREILSKMVDNIEAKDVEGLEQLRMALHYHGQSSDRL